MNNTSLNPSVLRSIRNSAPVTEHMRNVLTDPVVSSVVAQLEQAIQAHEMPSPVPGLHPDTTIAHRFHFEAGARAMLQALVSTGVFLDPSHKSAVKEDEEFDGYLPETETQNS